MSMNKQASRFLFWTSEACARVHNRTLRLREASEHVALSMLLLGTAAVAGVLLFVIAR